MCFILCRKDVCEYEDFCFLLCAFLKNSSAAGLFSPALSFISLSHTLFSKNSSNSPLSLVFSTFALFLTKTVVVIRRERYKYLRAREHIVIHTHKNTHLLHINIMFAATQQIASIAGLKATKVQVRTLSSSSSSSQ